jgi:TolB protein
MHRFDKQLSVCVRVTVVGLVLGALCGATLAAADSTPSIGQPRTLFAGSRRIYAFALGATRITWISRAQRRGSSGCEMSVRTVGSGRTSRAPVPRAGCGVAPRRSFAPQAPVLASGHAAWIQGYSCDGTSDCSWAIATITGGEDRARIVERADVLCDYTCNNSFTPRPALAGAGSVLVYSSGLGGADTNIDHVRRIVGRRAVSFAVPPGGGDIESLAGGGGAVEAISRVLDAGDACGCLDSPVWSPDGSKIAYLHGTFAQLQDGSPEQANAALAVMNADGSGRHDLTMPPGIGRTQWGPEFSWSPDGRQIAYDDPNGGIAIVEVDGSGTLQLGGGEDPAWSPDGSKIAFERRCGAPLPKPCGIFVMNPDGTNAHQLASPCGCDGTAWSPDGRRIAFSDGTLEVMNADGTNLHQLGADVAGSQPAWSPDSSQIVFRGNSGLWEIGADGAGLHQLTNDATDEHPSWSPDGKAIVFGSDRDDPYVNAHYPLLSPELYLIDPDGSDLRPLSFTKPSEFEQQKTFYSASGKPLPPLPGLPALAGNGAAVGSTSASGVHEITLFDATTGAKLAVVQVGAGDGGFAVAGADAAWVVFRVGRVISALNASSHQVVRLATAAADPVDLSVSGPGVAWAENIHGHGRIRGLDLPK